jgi:ankyrin repeat protein
LFIAAQNGHTSVVELLLKADGVDVNKAREDGTTLLFIAARHGHASVVELLLKADGVDVNKAREDGTTPLFIAAQNGHTSVVELLLKAGDLNTILANFDKRALLSVDLSLPYLQLLFDADKSIFEEYASEAVLAAAKKGQLECLRFLFDKGVCIEQCASEAAVSAAGSGELECLQFLHSKGCIITSECYEIAEDNYEHAVMEWLRSIDAPGIPLSHRQYLRNAMRILDEFKEHLPNGAYLELCEQLKGAYVTSGDADSFRE